MSEYLFILVLYRCTLEQSKAWQGLSVLLEKGEIGRDNIFIRDNTEHNIYLAEAYNNGLIEAQKRGLKMIVLLDQDTVLTTSYFEKLRSLKEDDSVWAPTLVAHSGEQLSPYYYSGTWGPWWSKHKTPDNNDLPMAFNSCLVLPLSVCRLIGGFNRNYPMDYLDFDTCRRLVKAGVELKSLGVTLEHNLSMADKSNYVSKERYILFLAAEKQYAADLGWRAQIAYRLRLALRAIKWTIIRHQYWQETWKSMFV